METEAEICRRYEAELSAIAALDRCYYLAPCPTRSDRADYAARQNQLQGIRSRFYAELAHARCEQGSTTSTVSILSPTVGSQNGVN